MGFLCEEHCKGCDGEFTEGGLIENVETLLRRVLQDVWLELLLCYFRVESQVKICVPKSQDFPVIMPYVMHSRYARFMLMNLCDLCII